MALIRFGVAPDHPEVKNCITTFNKVGSHERVEFIGNTRLGSDVSLSDLLSHYHAVLCTYGAARDRKLNIPGESRGKGVVSARDIVSLYNGVPDHDVSSLQTCLDTDTVAIVGVGNVALDVARLILAPVDTLRHTDVSETWLEMRSKSRVKKVVVLGRRGPLNVSFTIKELREMIKLPQVNTVIHPTDFDGVNNQLGSLERPRKRLTELLLKNVGNSVDVRNRSWELKLWRTPVQVLTDADDSVTGVECRDTRDADTTETVECGLLVKSVGYSSVCADLQLPWDDQRDLVTNEDGRVPSVPGLYVAGWLGTGPRGVIIDTMNTAFRVAGHLVTDINTPPGSTLPEKMGRAGLESKLGEATSWADWEKIDKEEILRGEKLGKARLKMDNVQEMLNIIRK